MDYWQIIIICFILLFLKSFAYGNFLLLQIAENHNNKYFKKHKSKNVLRNYFYIGYFKEVNGFIYIINFVLPVMAFILFLVESIIFIFNITLLFQLGYILYIISVFTAFFGLMIAMIYSWATSQSSTLTIVLAIIVIIVPVICFFARHMS